MKKSKSAKIVSILLVIALLFTLCACGAKKGSNESEQAANTASLYEYALQLEQQGNSEAAAAVFEIIAKNGDGAALINKAHGENELAKASDELEQIESALGSNKGGAAK